MNDKSIGVIDSGVGGLSVWRYLVDYLPKETYLYFGDNRYCPYGSKSREEITRRVFKIVDFLIGKGCKLVVVACNAITAAGITILRERYTIPFIGMEPAIKPAAINTKTGKVGILTTPMTLRGDLFNTTRRRYASNVQVVVELGLGLVELVESGDLYSESAKKIVGPYVKKFLDEGVDQIVLGCTHYPFLKHLIQDLAGNAVTVVDPSPAVAEQTRRVLKKNNLLCEGTIPSQTVFYTTGDPQGIRAIVDMIRPGVHEVRRVDLD